ncbi:EAL domain-containing protein [Leeia sp. TBRC 13508]|uniref:EAL domain-containing protein n=1 Tax=Leeia speluncae TaxID=2884804 RepID=A0ABS8D2M4_9NEIS|nr:EAL domain-containing protein [Leeia speluncae]MCB6182436.1 EAL domain-containing protein [Leeia speluncae]
MNLNDMPNILSAELASRFSSLIAPKHITRVESFFQPVFGLAHKHIIGFEALLRAGNDAGEWEETASLIADAEKLGLADALDEVGLDAHIAAFKATNYASTWLYLNITTQVFLSDDFANRILPNALKKHQFPAGSLVLEITIDTDIDTDHFLNVFKKYRALGCMVAIDQFGTGRGSVDLVWQIQPDIVKIDKNLLARAATDQRTHSLLKGLVALLHESGSLIGIVGVETERQAMVAMQTDCDFVQGFYFGKPQAQIDMIHEQAEVFDQLWQNYQRIDIETSTEHRERLSPYVDAFRLIPTHMMMNGVPWESAAKDFLKLAASELCFVLDADGKQIGESLRSDSRQTASPKINRLQETAGASWLRRSYFRDAMHAVGELQISRPYLSSSTGRFCVTLSIAFESGGQTIVLCGDIDWDQTR